MDRKTSRLVMYGGLVLILVVIVVVWALSLR
jgi:hypothetical protein